MRRYCLDLSGRWAPVLFSAFLGAGLAVGATACSDDGGNDQPDAAPADAAPNVDAPVVPGTGFLVAGDFVATGVASTISIPGLEVTPNISAGLASSDPVVRKYGDTLYIINRFGHDNITLVDANSFTLIDQISTGAGTNPQDVAVVGDKMYVAAFNSPGVVTIDSEGTLDSIDLSALDAMDGIPDCNSLYLVDTMLVVTCELLFNFNPAGPGRVAVIDTANDTLVTDFALETANPIGLIRATPTDSALGGDLLVGTVEFNAGLTTGCIERISVSPAIESDGCMIQNSELGGYVTGMDYGLDDQLYIGVTRAFDAEGPVAEVLAYDAAGGVLDNVAVSDPNERAFDVAVCPGGQLLFADSYGGIRVYNADGSQLTTELLDIGLPPIGSGMVCY